MEGEGASAPPGGAAALLFLPDGSALPLPLEPPPGPAAGELLRQLRGPLRLPARPAALALWLASPLLEVQLQPRQRPLRLARQWPDLLLRFSRAPPERIARDEPCLQLRRSVFFPKSKELELGQAAEEAELLRLLYEEARGHLLGGRFPAAPPAAEELGALLCRLRLGPFRPARHTPGTLRPLLGELLPAQRGRGGLWGALLRRGPRPPPPEERLLRAFARAPGAQEAPAELHRAFLRRCHALPGYGCAFFPGAIDRPPGGLLGRGGLRPVSVAVGLDGVTIIDPRERQVLLSLTYSELCWELVGAVGQDGDAVGQEGDAVGQGGDATEPPQLWLEFDGDHEGAPVNRLLRVFSPQAELMSALIECCIELGGAAPPPAPPPAPAPPPPAEAQPEREPEPPARGAPWRRLQRLATIDYVREGQELRRVKPPRRSGSFFGRGGGAPSEQG